MIVAILGSGITGLLAAKALCDGGFEKNSIDILTKEKQPPKPRGFTILHDNCGMELDMTEVSIKKVGSVEKYKQKLNYAEGVECSWNRYIEDRRMYGYNMFQALNILHRIYRDNIHKFTIKPSNFKTIKEHYDVIILTIPPNCLYNLDNHNFKMESTEIWIAQAKSEDYYADTEVVYYGDDSVVLRLSKNIFGWDFVEYCKSIDDKNVQKVTKPIKISRELPQDKNIIYTGRYGKWNKRTLAHQTYWNIYGMTRKNSIQSL